MKDSIELLPKYARMIWRHRWWSLLVSAVLCLVGWTAVLLLPNEYETRARIYVDTQSILQPLLQGLAVDADILSETAEIMQRTLLSRPNLVAVIRNTDLNLKVQSPEDTDRLVNNLAETIKVEGDREGRIYSISYTDSDPRRAKDVVEALMNTFIEKALSANRSDTSLSQEFLEKQIAAYEEKLERAELRLKEFKQENSGAMPGDGRTYFTLLSQAKQHLSSARLELREAERRRDVLRRNFRVSPSGNGDSEQPRPGATSGGSVTDRIVELEGQLQELLLAYTPNHPDVISVQQSIDRLRNQASEGDGAEQSQGPTTFRPRGIRPELQIELGNAEAQVAALRERVAEYEKRVAELGNRVDTIPRVEAELTKLTRDYDIIKDRYEELVRRREAAVLSQKAEWRSNTQFRIVEPPFVPTIPVAPDRPKLLTAVLFLGVAGGGIFGVLLAQARPVFSDARELSTYLGLPVIGTVSFVWTREQRVRSRRQVLYLALGVVVILGAYGGFMLPWMGQAGVAESAATLGTGQP